MKIKNILYVASFMAFAGINAAAADQVQVVVQEEQEVAVVVPRTVQSVLLELAGMHPAVGFIQRNFFGRAGGNLRVAGVYAYHVLKYPVVLSASYLPVSWVFGEGQGFRTVFTGAVGALTVAGFYKGICDAGKALEDEKKVEEHPVLQNRLTLAADRIAQSENMQGSLAALAGRIDVQRREALLLAAEQQRQFQQQRDDAARIAAEQTDQFQAEVVRQEARERELRESIEEQTGLAERTSSDLARLRLDAQEVANGMESLLRDGLVDQFDKYSAGFIRIDEWHREVLDIENNPAGLTDEGLERLEIIRRQQALTALGQEARAILTPNMSVHIAKLPELQRTQLMDLVSRYSAHVAQYAEISAGLTRRVPALEGRIRQQLSLTSGQQEQLESAVMAPPAQSTSSRSAAESSSKFPMVMFNGFGSRGLRSWPSALAVRSVMDVATQTEIGTQTAPAENVD